MNSYIINMSLLYHASPKHPELCENNKQLRISLKQTEDASDYYQNSPVRSKNQLGRFIQLSYPSAQEIYSHQNSRVLLVQDKNSTDKKIIKVTPVFPATNSKGFHQKQQFQFLQLLKDSKSQHIIEIADISKKQNEQICIMEFGCGGDLSQFCQEYQAQFQKSAMRILQAKNILWQTILGLEEIHSKGYVYRDLKPSNLVLTHSGSLKFCDFGLVIKIGENDPSLCGTFEYMPPERISNKRKNLPVDSSIDMWSLGIMAYELFMGVTPYEYDDDVDQLLDQIYGGYFSFDQEYPSQIRHFICNLLQPNPARRMTLEKAKQHKIFKENFRILNRIHSECKCSTKRTC